MRWSVSLPAFGLASLLALVPASSSPRRRGKKLGKATITAGASRGTSTRAGGHTIPILDVVSFEHLSESCAGR